MKYLQLGKQLHKGNIFSKFKNLLCVYFAWNYVYAHTMGKETVAHRSQERARELHMELHLVVNCMWVLGTKLRSSTRTTLFLC